MSIRFKEMLHSKWSEGKFVCVGLDTDMGKIPKSINISNDPYKTITAFNYSIIEATKNLVCAYKPNFAFYEAYGHEGILALHSTIGYIHKVAPNVPVILDAKRADIGTTNIGSTEMVFEYLGADAITVNPYLGEEALRPFFDYEDKGIIVLCRTSNPGAGEFQDLHVIVTRDESLFLKSCEQDYEGEALSDDPVYITQLYKHVAYKVSRRWNKNDNCLLVVGATVPEELAVVRAIVDDMPLLIPGIGAQGGDVIKTVIAGRDSNGEGMIINASRSIIYASSGEDFALAAERETETLNESVRQALLL